MVGTVAVTGKMVKSPVSAAISKSDVSGTDGGTDDNDAMSKAFELITNNAEAISKACPVGTSVKRGTFQMKMQQLLFVDKTPKELSKAVLDTLKDDEKLMELGGLANFLFDSDAGTITFQE